MSRQADDILKQIEADTQHSPSGKVLYLEGTTDTAYLKSLLGIAPSEALDDVVNGVYIVGLSVNKGSGSSAVKARVQLAQERGFTGVFGAIDGDGAVTATYNGVASWTSTAHLSNWPVYCIENLLALTCWPAAWGVAPDWQQVFTRFAPYAALNQLHRELKQPLRDAGLLSYINPASQPNLNAAQAQQQLRAINGDHLAARFTALHADLIELVAQPNLAAAHASLNGKWFAQIPRFVSFDAWADAVAAQGGNTLVKQWWADVFKQTS